MSDSQRKLQAIHDQAGREGLAVRFFDVRKTALVIALPANDAGAESPPVDTAAAECPLTDPS